METENTPNYQLDILEDYIKKYYPTLTGSHFINLIDIIYMAAIRNNININDLCNDLYRGLIDLDKFKSSNHGNIYNFIKNKKYIDFAKRIKDITVGSNGGMASVGKGEWLLSLGTGINPLTDKSRISIIKKGAGDLEYEDTRNTEEVKWNGGKVSLDKSGQEVNKIFNWSINFK